MSRTFFAVSLALGVLGGGVAGAQAPAQAPARAPARAPDRQAVEEAWKAGRIGEALQLAAQAVQAQPGDPTLRFLYGRLLSGTAQSESAVEQLKVAISLRPAWADAQAELAFALESSGDEAGAAAAAEAALKADPDHAEGKALREELQARSAIRAKERAPFAPGSPGGKAQACLDYLQPDLVLLLEKCVDEELVGALAGRLATAPGDRRALAQALAEGFRQVFAGGPGSGTTTLVGARVLPEVREEAGSASVRLQVLLEKTLRQGDLERLKGLLTGPEWQDQVSGELRAFLETLPPAEREAVFLRFMGRTQRSLVPVVLSLRRTGADWRIRDAVMGDERSVRLSLTDLLQKLPAASAAAVGAGAADGADAAPARPRGMFSTGFRIGLIAGGVIVLVGLGVWAARRRRRR
jgi:tetratricopeptide (TPR) repeat protein